ncbi:unnamed protein product [Auanema sp. JU1783]|nr:unnamed protein product [Auanema sp. JU1783]
MEVFAIIMYIVSTFGFLVIFLSMYLLIRVPTKLSAFSRFVVHGHDLATGLNQIFLTIALQIHVIFPCTGGYTAGLLTRLNVIGLVGQLGIGGMLLSGNHYLTCFN